MKKLLITTAILAAMTTGQALAGFGDGGAAGERMKGEANAAKNGKEAFHEAKQNGASDTQAERARDAAEASARESAKDDSENPAGNWIDDN